MTRSLPASFSPSVPGCEEVSSRDVALHPAEAMSYPDTSDVTTASQSTVIDIYSVGACNSQPSQPFLHAITLLSSCHQPHSIQALFDDGAMISAMSYSVYTLQKDQLGGWSPSCRRLRMADGSVVPFASAMGRYSYPWWSFKAS